MSIIYFCRPNFINYRDSENINTLNIFGNVDPIRGLEGPEGEESYRPNISLISTLDMVG